MVDTAGTQAALGDLETAAGTQDEVARGYADILEAHLRMSVGGIIVAKDREHSMNGHTWGIHGHQDHSLLMIGGGIGLSRGRGGETAILESLREELAEKRESKRSAFSEGEIAIEPSVLKSEGKLDLQKLFKIPLDRDQKEPLVGAVVRRLFFFII